MNKDDTYFEHIHRYLKGEMSTEEQRDFESRIAQSAQLKQDVADEKKLLESIEGAGDRLLKQKINTVHNQLRKEDFFKKINSKPQKFLIMTTPKKILAIAAAIIIAVILVWSIYPDQPTSNTDEIFAKYYEPESRAIENIINSLETMGMTDQLNKDDSLRLALELYDSYNYDAAITALDSFLTHHPENDTAQFYLALAHVNQSNYKKGAELLSPLSMNDAFTLQEEARWYLALCYLKFENGKEDAIQLLDIIASEDDYKRNREASEVLRMLGQK